MTSQFDARAAQWDDNPQRIRMACAIAEAIVSAVDLRKTTRALEFGCGTGLVTLCLADHVHSIRAVDDSSGMLEVLRNKIQAKGISNIVPMQADLTREQPIEDTFDLIFSSMVFHHIRDCSAMLKRFFEMLAPGGWIAIADLDAEDGGFHSPEAQYVHRGFDREVFKAALESAGFDAIRDRTAVVIPRQHEDGIRQYPIFLITGRKRP